MKTIYIKNKTSTDDEPPIEIEIESGDRVENIIEVAVDYWDLGDRGDYKAVKDGVDLDDTRRINDTSVNRGDMVWLVKKDGKEPSYTPKDIQDSIDDRRLQEERKRKEREAREAEERRKQESARRREERYQRDKDKQRERRSQEAKRILNDDVSNLVMDWMESDIGISKYSLKILDIQVDGMVRTYLLADNKGNKFEIIMDGSQIKNYRPLST